MTIYDSDRSSQLIVRATSLRHECCECADEIPEDRPCRYCNGMADVTSCVAELVSQLEAAGREVKALRDVREQLEELRRSVTRLQSERTVPSIRIKAVIDELLKMRRDRPNSYKMLIPTRIQALLEMVDEPAHPQTTTAELPPPTPSALSTKGTPKS